MKVMLLISGLGFGGAERLVTRLADNLAGRGHDVMLAYLGGAASLRPCDPRVRLQSLGVERPRQFARAILRLRRLVREWEPDVVHSHLFHANVLARLARLVVRMPRLVNSAHNTNEEGRFRLAAYSLTHRWADAFTNVSQAGIDAFERGGAARAGQMQVVHNAVATEDFRFDASERLRIRNELGVDPEARLLVCVARLDPAKDFPTLIRALGILAQRADGFRVAIAGDGPERARLEQMTAEQGLSTRVRFLGMRSDVRALLSAADVFVLSSAWEGFGLAIAEAMSCERIVVATAVGGIPEVVGDCGVLVPPAEPDALASALHEVLSWSPAKTRDVGARARARVAELFSEERALRTWLDLYAP